jgi:hypothetical protein
LAEKGIKELLLDNIMEIMFEWKRQNISSKQIGSIKMHPDIFKKLDSEAKDGTITLDGGRKFMGIPIVIDREITKWEIDL